MNPDPYPSATRASARVALVTCRALPDLDPDDRLLAAALPGLGVAAVPAVWDDPGVDWAGFELAVLRSPWDYPARRDAFVDWAAGVPRLANPAGIVAWNTDKRYLAELAAAGVPVPETTWVAPGRDWAPAGHGEIVVKPTVGAGSVGAGRYDLASPTHRRLAAEHVTRLTAGGGHVMVQPYLDGVDTAGETALIFFDGRYSHAIRKGALLTGPDAGCDGLYVQEKITPREPSAAERRTADAVLAALPVDPATLLYARVDLLPGPGGEPVLVELELTEPSLFLGTAAGAADRLAAAIGARLG